MTTIRTVIVLLTMLLMSPSTQAALENNEYTVFQGNRVEILLPDKGYENVSGRESGKSFPFYLVQEQPEYDDVITRGQFLELIFANNDDLQMQLDGEFKQIFPDLRRSSPYAEFAELASELKIINGYENGAFGPYDPITRGQMAKILVNIYQPDPKASESSFPDVPQSHIFYEHIEKAVAAGYFAGYPDGLMRPDRSINISEAETVISRAEERTISSLSPQPYWRAYLGIHRLREPGFSTIEITTTKDGKTSPKNIPLTILQKNFETVSFTLAPQKEELLGKEEQDTTWVRINAAKANTSSTQLWEGAFLQPTKGEETLGFGDKLYINGKYSGSHFGLDWANSLGTEIHASNTGIVTLAEWTTSYGNTIVIDHGHNIFTMYLHLSELNTSVGKAVNKGELIGKMGDTGVATGSHLHFTHFIGDIIVDSAEWM